ncbi:MAG: hypothetical protein WCK81_15695, partial [Betaproteobacteria bacterium]
DAGALPIYSRWPNGTFTAKIQGEAKSRYWLLKSTSRSLVGDIPNKLSLEGVIPASSTLKFEHATGMAAVVCIARALEHYNDTLTEWACVIRQEIPGQSFEWLVQNKPALLERLLAEYVVSSANRHETERALRVATLTKNAQAWLELANTEDDHQAEIERVSGVVAEQATTQALSNNTRKAAQSKNADPRAWVLSEWKNRKDKSQGKAAFARQYAPLVKRKFSVVVIPDTIARAWLKEVKP